MNPPIFFAVEDVLHIHERGIASQGGSLGVRDAGLLESAVAMPQAGFGDEHLHSDIYEMAAAYLLHIVMNHPFVDGNKRAGFSTALAFLDLNGVEVLMSQDEAYDLVIGVCERTVTKQQLAAAFRDHATPLAE